MQNHLVKTLLFDKKVRLFFVDNTPLINNIFKQNDKVNKMLKLLLGKTISAASVISGTLKGNQRVSMQITMSNPKYKVFADADANGNVRGYLNDGLLNASPKFINHISPEQLIGEKGNIRVIKGSNLNQFIGITDMPHQNITDDISHYFIQSEQTQTFIGTNIEINEEDGLLCSNAIFAQLLPGAPSHLLDEIKQIYTIHSDIFKHLGKHNEHSIEKKLRILWKDVTYMGYSPVQHFCGCSKEMFYGMLYALNKTEIMQVIHKKECIETSCHICGRTYRFNESDLQAFL